MHDYLSSKQTAYLVGILYVTGTIWFFGWYLADRSKIFGDSPARVLTEEIDVKLDKLEGKRSYLVEQIRQRALLPSLLKSLNDLKRSLKDHHRLVIRNVDKTFGSEIDDLDTVNGSYRISRHYVRRLRDLYDGWRKSATNEAFSKIQRQIYDHQHPTNCEATKKLHCDLNKNCGLGCQTHHALTCLTAALALNRTLILHSDPWSYSNKGWSAFFHAVTNCTTSVRIADNIPVFLNEADSVDEPDIFYPFYPNPTPDWLPFSVPKSIVDKVEWFHGTPSVWWIGQGLKYLWRIQATVTRSFDEEMRKKRLEKPFVGVHVRRTDKLLAEAKFKTLSNYMEYVEDYFTQLDLTKTKRTPKRVYLASDTADVYRQFRTTYVPKNYTLFGSTTVLKADGLRIQRFSEDSLLGIIRDIYFLSQSDHLVCTFSSNVCRLAYALMQTSSDATNSVDSLDDDFWLQGSGAREYEVEIPHFTNITGELNAKTGDKLISVTNLWNGFVMARNEESVKQGILPAFKITEKLILNNIKIEL